MADTLTAHKVRQALYAHFMGKWAVLFEVTARPEGRLRDALEAVPVGDADAIRAVYDSHRNRRIDALLVRRAPKRKPTATQLAADWRRDFEAQRRQRAADAGGPEPVPLFDVSRPAQPTVDRGDDGGLERLALEIKVSRGDFLRDVRRPEKQAPWRELAERHAYVVPAGLVTLSEVPGDSGLLEVSDRLVVTWARRVPRCVSARPLPIANQLDAFFRCARAEALALGLDHDGRHEDGNPEAMRVELARLRHEVELLEGRVGRAADAAEVWRRRYAALDPPACATCGKPIRPARRMHASLSGYLHWEHAPADEESCKILRTARAVHDEEAKPPSRRYGLYVPGPEPRYPDDDLNYRPA
jgi:hypothetical protein